MIKEPKENPLVYDDKARLTYWVDPAKRINGVSELQWHIHQVNLSMLPGRQRQRIIKHATTHKIALARA